MTDESNRRPDGSWAGFPVDGDRLLALFGLGEDPRARPTVGGLTLIECLYVICEGQMQAGHWSAAFRTITTIDQWQQRAARPSRTRR